MFSTFVFAQCCQWDHCGDDWYSVAIALAGLAQAAWIDITIIYLLGDYWRVW